MIQIFRSLPLVPLEEGAPPAAPTAPPAAPATPAPAPATVEATLAESDANDSHQTGVSPTSNQQTCGSSIQQTDV